MYDELPVFKRCCFCLPLRYGLITWAYLKLIVSGIIIAQMSYSLGYTIMMCSLHGNEKNDSWVITDITIRSILLIIMVMDFVLITVFIIGGHKKNVKLLRVFYFYSIAVWVLTILVSGVVVGLTINSWLALLLWIVPLLNYSAVFINIAVHTYFLLLLRSAIIKLKNNYEYRFFNNETEAECKLRCDEEMISQSNTSLGLSQVINNINSGNLVVLNFTNCTFNNCTFK